MRLTNIITVDTRPGWLNERSAIGEYGNASLCGCHSADFFTDGVVAQNRYLESPLITERKTVLCVDVHEPISSDVMDAISDLTARGEITKLVTTPHSKNYARWNDALYIRALSHATECDLVAKWDGDCIGYRREGFDVLALYLGYLNSGYSYVCQQTPLSKEAHSMEHASTRFFLTRRETLNLPEAARLLDDRARAERFPGVHLPCMEHILGALSGNTVLYPPCQNGDFVVWSWVNYFKGLIAKLNAMPYKDVARYVFETCGGPLGASDLIAKQL